MSLHLLFSLITAAYAGEGSNIENEVDRFIGQTEQIKQAEQPSMQNAFNPRITAFGDVFWSLGFDDGKINPASTPWLRSLEIDLRADVDPFAKAVATVALEQEDPLAGHAHADEDEDHSGPMFTVVPEEVFVDLVALPGGFSARLGQFLLPLGITNRMHPHDYPWPLAPMPFQETIGDHGLADVGGQLNYRVAHPLNGALTLQAAVVSGTHFDPDGDNAAASWVGRAELFQKAGDVDIGLGGSGTGLNKDWLAIGDAMVRWRWSGTGSLVWLSEVFFLPSEDHATEHDDHADQDEHEEHADQEQASEESSTTPSWTTTLQLQPARAWYLGVRYDQIGDANWIGGTVSFYTSEFLRIRTAALHHEDQWRMDAQLTFIWGSHPVEPYWVNR
jgi:hypothetical protein